jgi:hypothetical protein
LIVGDVKRANKLLRRNLITMNKALKALRERLRDDKNRHYNAMKRLSEKPFFQIDPNDVTAIF